ncbi:MAG: MHS family MFS transporter [Rubrobacter sp.]|nr:MHS family MFS transporter [Rubrobacter sp.]
MEGTSGQDGAPVSSIRQVSVASLVGTALEWYDYFLFGTAAALIFNGLFFPEQDPLTGTLLAFATFGVGFGARPIGGLVFGHYGDKIGRKTMLVITLVIMGVATCAIGLLPTYAQIGIWAPILLVVLRLVQGFGVGGEWGGAVLMAVEHAPAGKRGYYGSWPQMGVPAGLVLSTVVFTIFQAMPEEQFLAWGWRIPFLLSVVLVAVGLYVRLRLMESPAFQEVDDTDTEAQMPIVEVFRTYPRNILIAMGARVGDNMLFYIFSVFALTYVTEELGLPESTALIGVMIGATIEFFLIPFFGALSDRIGRRPVYMGGAIFCMLFAFPYFWLLNTEAPALIWLAISLSLFVGHAAMYAPQASFLSELFGTRVRYSGASIGYQLAPIVGGGIAPFIAVALLAWTGSYWPIAVYMIGMAAITVVSVYLATETSFAEISDVHEEQEREVVKN